MLAKGNSKDMNMLAQGAGKDMMMMAKGAGKDGYPDMSLLAKGKGKGKFKGKRYVQNAIKLRIHFLPETLAAFERQGIDTPWFEDALHEIRGEDIQEYDGTTLFIEDVAIWIEGRVENAFARQSDGKDQSQVQVVALRKRGSEQILDWEQPVKDLLVDGDTIIAECNAMTASNAMSKGNMEEMLEKFRKTLRFDLNDRVVCFCGPRWLSGHVVGTAVPDDGGILPYLVKTDLLPGLPSNTISVPSDDDSCCVQEVCFNPMKELHLIKAATLLVSDGKRPKLRFDVGESVVVRIRNSQEDKLEHWVAGTINTHWPDIPGPQQWNINGIDGEYPSVCAYKVDLANGYWIFCHRDHHTLIRRRGWEPQQRVKGTSKRMEVRKLEDGGKEQVDHQTERRKKIMDDSDDSDDDA